MSGEDIDDYDFDYDDNECWNCGGEGFVSICFTEYACIYPDEGCNECTRRCDVCQPRKPDPALQQVLADALNAGPQDIAHAPSSPSISASKGA